ncbi:stem cell self-renewal protein Piwi [Coprinellus micaceus]|uniref:Stem cell self-renewal protein Piwi n=1 Tax=Coprinellus micaceus TaxID=71717 RepID=A0A4Y7TQV6_COPMI|nr:stem cell self-renewal protein Piwi [Coprinellus micaceus]
MLGCRGSISIPQTLLIMQRISQLKNPTMIVGLDIGHASPGLREPSVVGLVYSIDQRGVKYSAFTALQEPRQESIVELRPMFKAALKDFVIHSGTLPRNVVVFRDGVSEGEYERVRKVEVKAIHDAMMDLLEEGALVNTQPRPNLTFIVVGKRHHALIFPKTDGVKDNRGNCKAGTVVSEGITQPDVENFYLMSHAALIGTSRSSHYIVLLDEVFGSTKLIEELSYALCHIYARATRSVSIPAPVYYADLVCRRKSFHFQPGVEEDLRFNDNASVASGSSYPPLDLKAWQEKFSKKAKLTAMNFL